MLYNISIIKEEIKMVIINCKSIWTRYYKIGKIDWRWGNKHHLQTAVELDEKGNVTEAYLIRYWGIYWCIFIFNSI